MTPEQVAARLAELTGADPDAAGVDDAFLLGPDLYVVPVFSDATEPVRRTYHLPAGRWRDLLTGQVREGPARVVEHVPLERIPLLARADLELDPRWS